MLVSVYTSILTLSVDILGAISYGIYLCGFPIQQSIVYLNGGCMNSYMNFIIAAPLSILCGAIIYYISEKKLNWYINKNKDKSNWDNCIFKNLFI